MNLATKNMELCKSVRKKNREYERISYIVRRCTEEQSCRKCGVDSIVLKAYVG